MKISQHVFATIELLFISVTALAGAEGQDKKQGIVIASQSFSLAPQMNSTTEVNSSEIENVSPVRLNVSVVPKYVTLQFEPGVSFNLKFQNYRRSILDPAFAELMVDHIKKKYGEFESQAFLSLIDFERKHESQSQNTVEQNNFLINPLQNIQGNFFYGNPDLAENATPEESEFYFNVLNSMEALQDKLTHTEYGLAGLTIHTLQSFHEYNQVVCREPYSYNTNYSRIILGVSINPQNPDIPAHEKAKYFYHQLKLAYDFASQDQSVLVRFFKKAFTELGCLEAAVQRISNWYLTELHQNELLRSGEKNRLALKADFAVFDKMWELMSAARNDFEKQFKQISSSEDFQYDPELYDTELEENEFRAYFTQEKLIEQLEKELLGKVGIDGEVISREKIRELVQMAQP